MSDDRARELQDLFQRRGYVLSLGQYGEGWRAILVRMRGQQDVTVLATGIGATKDEAAEAANAVFEANLTPVSSSVTLPFETLQDVGKAFSVELATQVVVSDEGRGTDSAYVEIEAIPTRHVAPETLRRLDALDVRLACIPKSDGGWSWLLFTPAGELLQRGEEDTLDDAKLAAIMDAYPPSGEDRALGERQWDPGN